MGASPKSGALAPHGAGKLSASASQWWRKWRLQLLLTLATGAIFVSLVAIIGVLRPASRVVRSLRKVPTPEILQHHCDKHVGEPRVVQVRYFLCDYMHYCTLIVHFTREVMHRTFASLCGDGLVCVGVAGF
jgi:hypothetical protein